MSIEILKQIAIAAGYAVESYPMTVPKVIGFGKFSEEGRFLYGVPLADFERIVAAVAPCTAPSASRRRPPVTRTTPSTRRPTTSSSGRLSTRATSATPPEPCGWTSACRWSRDLGRTRSWGGWRSEPA